MNQIGMDIGASTVKLAVLEEGTPLRTWKKTHRGALKAAVREALEQLDGKAPCAFAVTGSHAHVLTDLLGTESLGEIPAIVEGVRLLCPEAGSVMEIGSQNSRFITELQRQVPRFAVNEHCAGGTGSFFEDQMSRLGLTIEQYSEECRKATSVPRLSGRCSVFAKTDIIHRQQEGASVPDILLGLCYAMIRNYKAVIVRDLPVRKPVAFCGGVTENEGVARAIREIFSLQEQELIIPEHASFAAAIGAASKAVQQVLLEDVLRAVDAPETVQKGQTSLPQLMAEPGVMRAEPAGTGVIPEDGCSLGIDIGSTSTDLVLVSRSGELIHHQYLRTAGDPEGAVRRGLETIREVFGPVDFLSTGITGSGRERLGRLMGVDAIRDEITAQARAAAALSPETDTVFEIGGQDSKFISLRKGEVVDFQMNKICAAGTGSFVEEQAARMGIPLADFGPMALGAKQPTELGERCTVFIETAIASAAAAGTSQADIAAGLCHSIARNYLHKVVGSKHVGEHIVLQGGVAYNPGIVEAFRCVYGDRLTVSPYFPISGAYGVALLALEQAKVGAGSTFRGLAAEGIPAADAQRAAEVHVNTSFYQRAEKLLMEDYDGSRVPEKRTVGIPYVLMIHKFFPMANAFFKSLGFNVLLTKPTDEETIRLSQEYARGETCYPVKLIYGHMQQLVEAKVDYIFLPSIRTMKHKTSKVASNYGCVYMQTAPVSIARALHIEEQGIELLNPVFDLDFGKEAMAAAMLGLGKQLGIPKPFCAKALLSGAMAVRRHTEEVEKQGRTMLASLKPEDKVLVLITRNYGLSDPVLNMGIPDLLLERGYKILTLSHLPAHDLDISSDYPNLYWPFGQHIISGVKLVAHHPNLYAVCLNNHGCGPDTMLAQLVRTEMGEKPYLQLEVDEHFSKVGVITRVEAFLNSLEHRKTERLPKDFHLEAVAAPAVNMQKKADPTETLHLPPLGRYTPYLQQYFKAQGINAQPMCWQGTAQLERGRAETSSKEYLPFPALLDSVLRTAEQQTQGQLQILLPETEGAEADGLYARGIRAVLDRRGLERIRLITPLLETLPETTADLDLLVRSLLSGDLCYAGGTPGAQIPDWDGLRRCAERCKTQESTPLLGAVGTPLSLTVLDGGLLDELEKEGYGVCRSSFAEYLLFLWLDRAVEQGNRPLTERLYALAHCTEELHVLMGERSPFTADLNALRAEADRQLPRFSGGNGRYRWAKAVELSRRCDAVLTMAPRYENTATVLEMRGLADACQNPVFHVELDGDWDEASWSRLRSFLYYC